MTGNFNQSSSVSPDYFGRSRTAGRYSLEEQVATRVDETSQSSQVVVSGDPNRQLVLRQAPARARVALGKEKDRKPIDPPPIVQLIDKRSDGRNDLYNSPYLFMTSSLVAENYAKHGESQELPSNHLTGSLASSIHRLRDTVGAEGGFFVFGDLSVKLEGRFRLRFTLYEREDGIDSPNFRYISELITNVFTVYSPKQFPGMAESTFLTRSFSDQGVKLRLRKDPRPVNARKRHREPSDLTRPIFDHQSKRSHYGQAGSNLSYDDNERDDTASPRTTDGLKSSSGIELPPMATSSEELLTFSTDSFDWQNLDPPYY